MNAELRESDGKATVEEVKVRLPILQDLPAILGISNWAIRHTAASFKTEPDTLDHWVDLWNKTAQRYPWFVAQSNGSVTGFAMASPFHNRCGYANTAEVTVYVDPAHHAKGVGQALYRQLIPTLKAQGYKTLIGCIAIPNPASERLHEKFNFHRVGVLERVGWKLGRWHDVAYWQLVLEEGDNDPAPIKKVHEVRTDSTEGP